MSYYTPGGSNLNGHPHAPRMGMAQARELKSHINPDREVPDWMLELVAGQHSEPEVREVLDEYLQQAEELQDAGETLGFSCHGPFEDPLACMDGPCEACVFWQYDDIEYTVLTEHLAQREHETEKERAEAEAEYVAEYHTWVMEVAQAEVGG